MTALTAEQFLDLVWPKRLLTNETLELRLRRRSDSSIRREFARSVPEFLERARSFANSYDVYFALGTRYGTNGGTKRDVYRVATAWADLDDRTIKDCKFRIKPDIVVKSGNGLHCYWTLSEPLLIRGEGERWKPIEAVNRALAYQLKGDTSTIDISRVLRVPGTMNHKYSPAREVKAFAT
jgi:hypothetical protein